LCTGIQMFSFGIWALAVGLGAYMYSFRSGFGAFLDETIDQTKLRGLGSGGAFVPGSNRLGIWPRLPSH
jgi:hypothetical protein